jgi:hypothetical protein
MGAQHRQTGISIIPFLDARHKTQMFVLFLALWLPRPNSSVKTESIPALFL